MDNQNLGTQTKQSGSKIVPFIYRIVLLLLIFLVFGFIGLIVAIILMFVFRNNIANLETKKSRKIIAGLILLLILIYGILYAIGFTKIL